jgi:hypothetical protein
MAMLPKDFDVLPEVLELVRSEADAHEGITLAYIVLNIIPVRRPDARTVLTGVTPDGKVAFPEWPVMIEFNDGQCICLDMAYGRKEKRKHDRQLRASQRQQPPQAKPFQAHVPPSRRRQQERRRAN